MSVLVSFDGSKGVGKTTLIQQVAERLRDQGRAVATLVEKDLIPAQEAERLSDLYAAMKQVPTAETDQKIADALKLRRQIISHDILPKFNNSIVLLDRWYPSDAVFRRFLSWSETVAANIAAGVRIPDLTFAVSCAPEVSWERATSRARTLDSKVIHSYEDHVQATLSFEQAAQHFGWHIVRSDNKTPDELSEVVFREVVALMGQH